MGLILRQCLNPAEVHVQPPAPNESRLMLISLVVIAATLLVAFVLLSPKLRGLQVWRAMITPLASIIGSGFLVLGPILTVQFGAYAPLVMAALCGAAYLFGGAIRFNMTQIERHRPLPWRLEVVSSWALAFAYVISVAFYLNLFGAFGVSLTSFDSDLSARVLTTLVYLVILAAGCTGGFRMLERMEYFSVTVKLAIIAGLLAGLALFFGDKTAQNALVVLAPQVSGWSAVTLLFGLVVAVQGFETSRYLGDTYDTATRLTSMRWAQAISSAIYMIYIGLLAYVFPRDMLQFSETAIIDMMALVAPVLPLMLVAAALSAQFSAAVADTGGSGGLMVELSGERLDVRGGYVLLTAVGLLLTWGSDVFEIISFASRAFAIYYGLQAAIAAFSAAAEGSARRSLGYGMLAALGTAIAIFGRAIEG